MFFRISHQQDTRFPHHHRITDRLWLSTDAGWLDQGDRVIKGMADSHPIDRVPRTHRVRGNYCAIHRDRDRARIVTDLDRGFPMWRGEQGVTNLFAEGEPVWADQVITVGDDLTVTQETQRTWHRTQARSDSETVAAMHDILLAKFRQFQQHNRLPVRIFLTGGVDTTLLWAYLDHVGVEYEVLDHEYMKYTPFYKANTLAVRRFWGYRQTHLWDTPTVLVSGAMGDEVLMRGPVTLGMAMARHGLTIDGVMRPEDYHWSHFSKYTHQGHEMHVDHGDQIMNMLANDHQHWHIDQTLHFTPFKDLRLASLALEVSPELLTAQARNGEINRDLIARMSPEKLQKITTQKNR